MLEFGDRVPIFSRHCVSGGRGGPRRLTGPLTTRPSEPVAKFQHTRRAACRLIGIRSRARSKTALLLVHECLLSMNALQRLKAS